MASVVKKGNLDVKQKGKLGSSYKSKFVILRRNTNEGTKMIEICENNDMECLSLDGMWTIQDKASQNKKRFAFELVIGPHIVMTFSCPSLTEREEWTESFRILNSISSHSPQPPMEDMYSVILERNLSAVELGVSGPCLLRVQDSSLVLYSECGRSKLHHWAFENIKNISTSQDQIILEAYRPGSDTLMEFKLNTDIDTARHILMTCNLLLEDEEKVKRMSSLSLNFEGTGGRILEEKIPSKSASLSRSFLSSLRQTNKIYSTKEEKGVVRRVRSFNDKAIYNVRRSMSPDGGGINGSRHSITSQELYTINSVNPVSDEEGSPPPVPPKAPTRRPRSIGIDTVDACHIDPDYSVIKDDVNSPRISPTQLNKVAGSTVDKQLDDLLRDIEVDNIMKQRRKTMEGTRIKQISPYAETPMRKTVTLGSRNRTSMEDFEKRKKEYLDVYGERQASDYLEPVPSTKIQEKRSSIPVSSRELGRVSDVSISSKRHSLSGDFPSLIKHLDKEKPHHDYHTIPDKPPQHSHTSSTDSTHSSSGLSSDISKRGWMRSQSGSDDPPSPPLPPRPSYLTQPPTSPTRMMHHLGKKGDEITPYATVRNIILPPDDSPAPPLPPRSPNKRDKVPPYNPHAGHQHRCPKCNGMKLSNKLPEHHHHHMHRLPPSPPSNGDQALGDLHKKAQTQLNGLSVPVGQTHTQTKSQSPPPYLQLEEKESKPEKVSYGSEIDSALALLDSCVEDLKIFEEDLPERVGSPTKTQYGKGIHTDLDEAIQRTKGVENDLFQAKHDAIHRSASVSVSHNNHNNPIKHTQRSMTIKPMSPSMSRQTKTVTTPPSPAPPIPPRSRVSLGSSRITSQNSSPSLFTPLELTDSAKSHKPLHRYHSNSSYNHGGSSQTVFIHHLKDN